MRAATQPRAQQRLLLLDAQGIHHRDAANLADELREGDLLVLNDAATLPGSLRVRWRDARLELRLAGRLDPDTDGAPRWQAVLFDGQDWHTDTDQRAAPPRLPAGARLRWEESGVDIELQAVDARSARLLTVRFDCDEATFLIELYRLARPIQYSYLARDLALREVQTGFAGRPWSVEMPSAGRPLSHAVRRALQEGGVELALLTHGAGLSATGDPDLDRLLPLPERYEIPAATVAAIERCRARGGRVVAVGTTVLRALEGNHRSHGRLRPGAGVTDLVIEADTPLAVVDGLLSGIHEAGESHWRVLAAVGGGARLDRALEEAEERGYLIHEFGDASLVLRPR